MAAIDDRRRPVDQPGGVEAPQQFLVQGREHSRGLPLLQPAMRSRRRAAQLARKVLPRDPREQHEHDRPEAHAVIHARAPTTRISLMHRDQRLNDAPELVADPPHRRRHATSSARVMFPSQVRHRS